MPIGHKKKQGQKKAAEPAAPAAAAVPAHKAGMPSSVRNPSTFNHTAQVAYERSRGRQAPLAPEKKLKISQENKAKKREAYVAAAAAAAAKEEKDAAKKKTSKKAASAKKGDEPASAGGKKTKKDAKTEKADTKKSKKEEEIEASYAAPKPKANPKIYKQLCAAIDVVLPELPPLDDEQQLFAIAIARVDREINGTAKHISKAGKQMNLEEHESIVEEALLARFDAFLSAGGEFGGDPKARDIRQILGAPAEEEEYDPLRGLLTDDDEEPDVDPTAGDDFDEDEDEEGEFDDGVAPLNDDTVFSDDEFSWNELESSDDEDAALAGQSDDELEFGNDDGSDVDDEDDDGWTSAKENDEDEAAEADEDDDGEEDEIHHFDDDLDDEDEEEEADEDEEEEEEEEEEEVPAKKQAGKKGGKTAAPAAPVKGRKKTTSHGLEGFEGIELVEDDDDDFAVAEAPKSKSKKAAPAPASGKRADAKKEKAEPKGAQLPPQVKANKRNKKSPSGWTVINPSPAMRGGKWGKRK